MVWASACSDSSLQLLSPAPLWGSRESDQAQPNTLGSNWHVLYAGQTSASTRWTPRVREEAKVLHV